MLMNEYCTIKEQKLSDNMPTNYKTLLLSNFVIYHKIKTLCTLLPNVNLQEQLKIKSIIKKLLDDWNKNDLEITIEERKIKPIDPYNREFRFTTSNMGKLMMEPAMNSNEEIIECPSNTDFDPYEYVAINLEPSNKMFETKYEGQNTEIDYSKMNYKLAKNSIQDEDRFF